MNPASNGLGLLLVFAACAPAKAPDTRDGGAPEPSASAVAVSAPPAIPTTTRAPTNGPSASALEPPPTPPPLVASTAIVPPPPSASSAPPATPVVACKTVDDCWVSAKRFPATPIARPKHLKGKKFKPCVDGEVAPTCGSDGACGLLGYDC